MEQVKLTIPPGSRHSNYWKRLQYAFRDKEKLTHYMDQLMNIQQSFIFMSTSCTLRICCLQQLTLKVVPIGSLQGTVKQIPAEISLKEPSSEPDKSKSATYQATIILEPVKPAHVYEDPKSREEATHSHRVRREKEEEQVARDQKETLANIRQSPHFSMKLFEHPHVRLFTHHTHYHGGGQKEDLEKIDEVEDDSPVMGRRSRGQAEADVDELLTFVRSPSYLSCN